MQSNGSRADLAERARGTVAAYAAPDFSWSILLRADLDAPLPPYLVRDRMAGLAARYPHLGAAPAVTEVPAVAAVHEPFASVPYAPGEPLVRVAVGTAEPTLLLAAHHGAVDGLGLLALLGAALDEPVRSDARGVADRAPATSSFLWSAARRGTEALVAPPTRIWHPTTPTGTGDVLRAARLPHARVGSAALVAAAHAATLWWNASHGAPSRRVVAAVGASLRSGADLRPEYRAALFRLRLPRGTDRGLVGDLLRAQPREADFPAVAGRGAALARRLLANRLGATFLASNIGVVHAGDRVRALAFYPVDSGPSGVAFGAVSTATTTTLTVRARALPPDALEALLKRLVAAATS
jgi:hypothetical protein